MGFVAVNRCQHRLDVLLFQGVQIGCAQVLALAVPGRVQGGDVEAAQNHGPLQQVAQFAAVARPVVALQKGHFFVAQLNGRQAQRGGQLGHEVRNQVGQVFAVFAQRGQGEIDDLEPVIQVGAEVATVHGLGQIAVGGGDDAHVHGHALVAAHGLDVHLVDGAQQGGLQPQWQLGQLVQKKGAALCAVEQAIACLAGSGEGTLGMAKQLALQQLGRQRGAVHGGKRATGARAEGVQFTRHQFFACAGLALQQHVAGHGGDAGDGFAQCQHAG